MPVHRDQLRAQRSVSRMGKPLSFYLTLSLLACPKGIRDMSNRHVNSGLLGVITVERGASTWQTSDGHTTYKAQSTMGPSWGLALFCCNR